jgi:hypothetical protein
MPMSAAMTAVGRYQLLCSAAGSSLSSRSRRMPPPNPVAQVEPAVAELRGEQRSLQAADADGEDIRPGGDEKGGFSH